MNDLAVTNEDLAIISTGAPDIKGYHQRLADFRKRFNKLRSSKSHRCNWMEVTPEMAEIMLEYNRPNNRPIKASRVGQYAREMTENNWVETAQGISFGQDGLLIDGQHRLTACIAADKSFVSLVAFGLPIKGFMKADTGSGRTAGDVLHITLGIKRANESAAAARWIEAYETDVITKSRGTSTGLRGHSMNPTIEDVIGWYKKNEDIAKRTDILSLVKKSKLISPSMCLAFYTLFCRKNKGDADDFFTRLCSGVGISSKTDAAGALRNKLIDNRASQSGKLSSVEMACFLVKAWNAFRKNEPVKTFRWAPGERFPRIV